MNFNFQNPLDDKLSSSEKEFQLLNEIITSKSIQLDYIHEVRPDLFHDSINRQMFHVIQELLEENKDINQNSVRNHLKLNSNPMFVRQMEDQLDIALTYGANDTFSNVVKDLDTLRKNRILFEEIIGSAKTKFMNNEPIDEIIDDITESIISMESNKHDRTTYSEHVDRTMDEIENPDRYPDFVKTRWEEWNKQIGGIIKDRVYVIGGESGAGKTAFICDLITQLSEDYSEEVAILFYSYEMSQSRIITRLISKNVKFTERQLKQRFKKLTAEDVKKVKSAVDKIKKFPLEIVYETLSDKELRMRTRRFALKNKGKHLIIFLDHIGLVAGEDKDMRIKTIQITNTLKSFATDYKASVFPLTQLKKELADTNNSTNVKNFHRPNDSHIMESGSVKAIADFVGLLWRPDMRRETITYNNHTEWDVRGKLFLCNIKNRDGQSPTDIIFGCDIKYSHLYNLPGDPFSPIMTDQVKEEMMKNSEEMGGLDMSEFHNTKEAVF